MFINNKPDCWIETTVRCKGGKNMDGFYILGHYPTQAAGQAAYDAHKTANPKAVVLFTVQNGCPKE